MSLSRKILAATFAAGAFALTAAALPGPAAAKQPFQSLASTDALPMSAAEMEATQGKFNPITYADGVIMVADGTLALSLGNPLGQIAIDYGHYLMLLAFTQSDPFAPTVPTVQLGQQTYPNTPPYGSPAPTIPGGGTGGVTTQPTPTRLN